MPFSEEEKRQRKNQRQREYARRTGYAANKKYAAKHPEKSVVIAFKLQRSKDDDVIDRIGNAENKAEYLRMLVRRDIEENPQ